MVATVRSAVAQADYRVSRPADGTRAPVVLLVSGCSGFVAFNGLNIYDYRAEQLVGEGYAVVYVDYLRKRGLTTCGGGNPSHQEVAADLFAAAAWVGSQPWADNQRIFAIGWSYGGGGILAALAQASAGAAPIAKVVLYYPVCREARGWTVPVQGLIFLAGLDDLAPAALCEAPSKETPGNLLRVVTYPNARHAFDAHSLPESQALRQGTIGYNAPAAQSSWEEVRAFLR